MRLSQNRFPNGIAARIALVLFSRARMVCETVPVTASYSIVYDDKACDSESRELDVDLFFLGMEELTGET